MFVYWFFTLNVFTESQDFFLMLKTIILWTYVQDCSRKASCFHQDQLAVLDVIMINIHSVLKLPGLGMLLTNCMNHMSKQSNDAPFSKEGGDEEEEDGDRDMR